MDKLVFNLSNKKLTLEQNGNTLSINFFSIEEDNEFIITSLNKEIYSLFDSFIKNVNNGRKNLLGENLKEVFINDEGSLSNGLLVINSNQERIRLSFSSTFYTSIVVIIDSSKDKQALLELYQKLLKLDLFYYQTYIDETFNEGREYRIELKDVTQ